MRRYPRNLSYSSYSFGPGPLSPAIKLLIAVNVAVFLIMALMPPLTRQAVQEFLGLMPEAIFESFRIWQPVTYMFLHGTIGHILFNMLSLWMFGTELEHLWGTRPFLRYYFITGIAAAITTIVVSLLSAMGDSGGGIAHITHLGGLVAGYVMLRGRQLRLSPANEVRYRYLRWKMDRARKKFGVYSGGKDWDKHIH
jgi:membrane associated rhomboid family serine protease